MSGWVSDCQLKLSGSLLLEEELKVHFLKAPMLMDFIPISENPFAFSARHMP